MRKITIRNTKNITSLEFILPDQSGVYLLVGANGAGKTTILVCLDRICNPQGFAQGFSASRNFGEVDQYREANIEYEIDNPPLSLIYRKKSQRWAVSPKRGSVLLSEFGYSNSIFIRADSKRIDVSSEEIRAGVYVAADTNLKRILNEVFETNKYSRLKRLRNANGRGRQATFFYIIQDGPNNFYSEKRFSTGELAVLRLVERLLVVENNSLVLLDEAEMALHPRIQYNLLKYLDRVSSEKNLTVFISTHSVTMIKTMNKHHIMLLNSMRDGNYEIINPCYPAKAIGNVDFLDNIIYDAVFFVEDDMARLVLKKMLRRFLEIEQTHMTITNCIVPVGGYRETLKIAKNTRNQLLGRSFVCAFWDHDVFEETIPENEEVQRLYSENRDVVYDLGCTPEVWMIEKLESNNEEVIRCIGERFHCDVNAIVENTAYIACNSPKPRKRAKAKMDIVIDILASRCGDSKEIVLDALASVLVDNSFETGDIRRIIAPIFNNIT